MEFAGGRMIKGLELSELYFREFGEKMLDEKFPEYKEKIAVGLVGDGSECYGFDDDISKDHDWGPSFCLWLDHEDYQKIGGLLQKEYNNLPKKFRGFERQTSQWGGGRIGVLEIGAFYQKYLGIPNAPQALNDWLYIPENHLSTATNGKMFYDPLGKFSNIRNELLNFYPEDVRLVKIAARCMSVAQAGQYNYIRSIAHKEYFAAQYSEIKFSADIMSLIFLLNRQYAPYYKWRHRAVLKLPLLGEFIYSKISEMINTANHKRKSDLIELMCSQVIKEFHNMGLSNSSSDFLLDHGPVIHDKIKDENLRKRDVWAG